MKQARGKSECMGAQWEYTVVMLPSTIQRKDKDGQGNCAEYNQRQKNPFIMLLMARGNVVGQK